MSSTSNVASRLHQSEMRYRNSTLVAPRVSGDTLPHAIAKCVGQRYAPTVSDVRCLAQSVTPGRKARY